MIKVTFKDVGQGDSIVFEWSVDGKHKLGLIDCKTKGGKNPTLEHIINTDIDEIEFIIMSHPHEDHYSGLYAILEYCLNKEIKIKGFFYTIKDIQIEYWRFFSPNITGSSNLVKLFDKAGELYDLNLLEMIPLTYGYRIELYENATLICLSPSIYENNEYLNVLKYEPEYNRMRRSRAANYLSTLFILSVEQQNFLFTSDVEKITFNRLKNRNWDTLENKQIFLSQIPHHGSENNHHEDFWLSLNRNIDCYAVISSGEHKLYAHPHYSVIESLERLGYKIFSTEIVHGIVEHLNKIKLKGLKLDTNSYISEEHCYTGDQEFFFPL